MNAFSATRAQDASIRKIVIAGGGTAGWMCAAALSRFLDPARVEITLIESDEIGTVGVGEATIPTLLQFNALLGIDEGQFLSFTQGTFKLGIEFVDWYRQGHCYFHPFGVFGRDRNGIKFHQFWLRHRREDQAAAGELGAYNLSTVAARTGRFLPPHKGADHFLASMRYAYHFDASLYARFLRGYAERNRVRRIEGKISEVELHNESGLIETLVLESGLRVPGELFVDCTGFRSLLLGQTLETSFVDWRHWLPCDRAIAMPCESAGDATPFTRSMADAAGWRWRIPLQHRIGNGYVYCSEFIRDDDAAARLRENLDGHALGEPRQLRFAAGRRDKFWVKNCVALGLAAGFLEPLESTSIHLIQTGIQKLIALFPDTHFSSIESDEFNRLSIEEYEYTRDFIILHYALTEREDTPLWRHCRNMRVPETVERKIQLFKQKGRIFRWPADLFTEDSWIAVMLGQGVDPGGYDPLVDAIPAEQLGAYLAYIRDSITRAAASMPTHMEYVRKHCPAVPENLSKLPRDVI
jgi:tryptophan halogenase